MHIITGLLLSKLFAGKGKKKAFKGFRGVVEIRHAIPGRIRFYIPVLKMDAERAMLLEKQLLKAQAVKQIQINPLLGTLLVVHDPGKIDAATLTGVLVKLLGLEKELEKSPQSLVGGELQRVLKSANMAVYEQTDGLLDLNSAVSLGFLSLGIWSVLRSPSILPAGISMLYWAYSNASR